MKTLVILAHPHYDKSWANKHIIEVLKNAPNVTIHDLYAKYPNGKIDVAKEQALLLEHDRILFQYPIQWYMPTALLKQWLDDVLLYGFSYGPGGDKLKGKEFVVSITAAGPTFAYQAGGFNNFTISEFLKPMQQTANLCSMVYKPAFCINGVAAMRPKTAEDEVNIKAHAEKIKAFLA